MFMYESDRARGGPLRDPLTGLPSWDLLRDRCEHLVRRSARRGQSFAIGHLELETRGSVRLSRGQETGDELLVEAARRIGARVRDDDTVARVGRSQFLVLIERVDDESDTRMVGERLLCALSEPFERNSRRSAVGASGGMLMVPSWMSRDMAAGDLELEVRTLLDEARRARREDVATGGGRPRVRRASAPLLIMAGRGAPGR